MKFNVAAAATSQVDLSKPETMEGIGVSLASMAPVLMAAQEVVGAYEVARIREQKVEPTKVRISIALLRGELTALGAWPELSEGASS